MTTAYSIKQTTPRLRKRSALTSTNARIVRLIFSECIQKWLNILLAIDEYNHEMNGVDRANQIRQNYTIYRPQNYRVWRAQWYWILDTAATNSYFVTVKYKEDSGHRAYRLFRDNLTMQLLNIGINR
jgi:hypothetical protein